jgi:hypothetical protein
LNKADAKFKQVEELDFRVWVLLGLAAFGFLWGCPAPVNNGTDTFLLRVGTVTVSPEAFEKRLAHTRVLATHGQGLQIDAGLTADEVLGEIVEELLIRQYAKDQDIGVTDVEVDRAMEEIRGQLPMAEFEILIIESAQSLEGFRRDLKNRLLAGKVIRTVRQAPMESVPGGVPVGASQDQMAVYRLAEGQGTYGQWLESLRKLYPVTLNPSLWKAITLNGHQERDPESTAVSTPEPTLPAK